MIQEISNNCKVKFVKIHEFLISLMDCLFLSKERVLISSHLCKSKILIFKFLYHSFLLCHKILWVNKITEVQIE